jgi:hypothetical protein
MPSHSHLTRDHGALARAFLLFDAPQSYRRPPRGEESEAIAFLRHSNISLDVGRQQQAVSNEGSSRGLDLGDMAEAAPRRRSRQRLNKASWRGESRLSLRLQIGVAQVQPWQLLLRKYVPRRMKARGLVKCTDMEMRFGRQTHAFASQC